MSGFLTAASSMKLADEAQRQAQGSADEGTKKRILASVDEMGHLLTRHMGLARDAVANPHDKAKEARLEQTTEGLRNATESVLEAMANNPDEAAAWAANQQARAVKRMTGAAFEGDAHAVELAAKAIVKKQPKLESQIRYCCFFFCCCSKHPLLSLCSYTLYSLMFTHLIPH